MELHPDLDRPLTEAEARALGCTCQWWRGGSILLFDHDCPVGVRHVKPSDRSLRVGSRGIDQVSDTRITRDQMFLEMCQTIRKRSTCRRGKVGCMIVKDGRVVSTGYNGSPPGAPHCIDLGCEVEENNHEAGCTRTIHAEANAIAYAARAGLATEGGVLYCTHSPCYGCAKLLLSAGIVGVHYLSEYRRPEGAALLREAGVDLHHWKD